MNATDIEGDTASNNCAILQQLMCAPQKGKGVLRRRMVNTNHRNDCDFTAILFACEKGCLKCVDLLIKAGADVNMKVRDGLTPLIQVFTNDDDDCLDVLVQAGADVNHASQNGTSPLSVAAFVGSRKCLETLLIAGADVNIVKKERATPLVRASVGGNVNISKCLLKADYLINKSTRRLENALKSRLKHCRPIKRDLAMLLFAAGEKNKRSLC